MNIRFYIIAILLLTFFSTDSSAQLFARKRARKKDVPPKAILVELFTYKRKLEYYQKKGMETNYYQLLTDRDSVRDRLVMDFSDNFNYCPVYFFADTNMQKVKEGNFDGVLLDANLQPAKDVVLSNNDKNFWIVFFGNFAADMPVVTSPHARNDLYDYDSGVVTSRKRKRLVVLDSEGKNLPSPLPNGANSIDGGPLAKPAASYIYRSPVQDVYYRPYAKRLNAKMHEYFTPKKK